MSQRNNTKLDPQGQSAHHSKQNELFGADSSQDIWQQADSFELTDATVDLRIVLFRWPEPSLLPG